MKLLSLNGTIRRKWLVIVVWSRCEVKVFKWQSEVKVSHARTTSEAKAKTNK